jgi:hypothetical protein
MRIRSHADAVRTKMESSDALLERGLAARPLCLAWDSRARPPKRRPILQTRDCKVAASDRRANVAEMGCSEAAAACCAHRVRLCPDIAATAMIQTVDRTPIANARG